jgi:hypothetical protein
LLVPNGAFQALDRAIHVTQSERGMQVFQLRMEESSDAGRVAVPACPQDAPGYRTLGHGLRRLLGEDPASLNSVVHQFFE